MTDARLAEIIDTLRYAAVLLAGVYLLFHMVRYVVLMVNRGIDRDALRDMPGHVRHRYAAWDGWDDVPYDGHDGHDGRDGRDLPDDIDELHSNMMARRDASHASSTSPVSPFTVGDRIPPGRRDPHGNLHPSAGGGVAAVTRSRRASPPIRLVTHGWFSGCRVYVLGESLAYPGTWFVEVAEGGPGGVGRGVRTVVDEGWLSKENS